MLGSLDEVGDTDARLVFAAGVEGGEALLPAFADLGRPRAVFIGPGRSTLRVIESNLSSRRLSVSNCFTFSSNCQSRVVVSGGRPSDAPGSMASRTAFKARSSSW
jgi:hypothetical protein